MAKVLITNIYFNDISSMVNYIREYTRENCTYVVAHDDIEKRYFGWYCLKANTCFCILVSKFNREVRKNEYRYLDTALKRKIASIYLSNCSSDKEYDDFINRVNKLKAFW